MNHCGNDPMKQRIVQRAKHLGYQLFAHDGFEVKKSLVRDFKDNYQTVEDEKEKVIVYSPDGEVVDRPFARENYRSSTQADRIMHLLESDPSAKIVISTGIGHIWQAAVENWYGLAKRLEDRLKEDVLTIEQGILPLFQYNEMDTISFACFTDQNESPVLFDEKLKSTKQPIFDIQVATFAPKRTFDARSLLNRLDKESKAIFLSKELFDSGFDYPCILSVHEYKETWGDYIPSDVIVFDEDFIPLVYLKKGVYVFQVRDSSFNTIQRIIEVK